MWVCGWEAGAGRLWLKARRSRTVDLRPCSSGRGCGSTLDVRPQLQVYHGFPSVNWRLIRPSSHEGHRSADYSLYKLQISGFRAQEGYIVPQLYYMTGLVALDSEPHRSEDGFPKSTEAPGTQTC
jgi:hypothetical protein